MTEVLSQQVGKRWFKLLAFGDPTRIPIVQAEASYSVKDQYWPNSKDHGKKVWTITGKGSKKYRNQIIDHLEGKYFDGNPEAN
jgi:hypothetical protein